MSSLPLSDLQRSTLERATQRYAEALDDRTVEYLRSRGLLEVASSLRFGTVVDPEPEHTEFVGRLAIPYLGPRDNVYGMKFRCIEDHVCKDVGCKKYMNVHGFSLKPYNTRALVAPTDYIFVQEGELDAATIEACGWPAIGLPGASDWKAHYPRMLADFNRVIHISDGDDAGKALGRKILDTMPSVATVIVAAIGEDVNSTYVKGGKDALTQLIRGSV